MNIDTGKAPHSLIGWAVFRSSRGNISTAPHDTLHGASRSDLFTDSLFLRLAAYYYRRATANLKQAGMGWGFIPYPREGYKVHSNGRLWKEEVVELIMKV